MYTLLIVDDEAYSRNGIAALIERRYSGFFRVLKAETGTDGLQLARAARPDLVISDIRMPQMDGLTMCRKMTECLSNPRIIFMSAYSELEYYRTALKMHALCFIEKPIVPEELLEEVGRALRSLDEARSSAEASPLQSSSDEGAYVGRIKEYVQEHYQDPEFSLAHLEGELHLTKNYIGSLFKKKTGMGINAYLNQVRMEKAKELLRNPANHVSDVGFMVGMDNTDYFTRKFKEATGKTPSEFRR